MTLVILAHDAVAHPRTPELDGRAVGRYIVSRSRDRLPATIDVSRLPPADLVSGFINALLSHLEKAGFARADFSEIEWKSKYESEARTLAYYVGLYLKRRADHHATSS